MLQRSGVECSRLNDKPHDERSRCCLVFLFAPEPLGTDRAQYIGGSAYGPGACKNIAPCVDYLNASAFMAPAKGAFGNVGKGSLNGPNFMNWDAGLFKNIPLGSERLHLRFQAEFFNVMNRVNLGTPNQLSMRRRSAVSAEPVTPESGSWR